MALVTLADFRPSPRADGLPWTEARVEESEEPGELGDWGEVETFEIEEPDEDPAHPALRSFTVATEKEWLRIIFLDEEEGEDQPSPEAAAEGKPYRPTLKQVSAILRTRTATNESEEAGEFGSDTRPTDREVKTELIPAAIAEVDLAVGVVPGELLDIARGVAAWGAAAEIERSYLPEQVEPNASSYVSLRLTSAEEIDKLCRTLQWWYLNEKAAV